MISTIAKSRILSRLLPLTLLFLALAGCAGKPKPQAAFFWPPPPDEPRVQFLTGFKSSKDLKGKSGLSLIALGAEDEGSRSIDKPFGLAVGKGKIYVSDTPKGLVWIIDLERQSLEPLPGNYSRGKLAKPTHLTLDADGNLYVADTGRKEVVVYDAGGNYLKAFGAGQGLAMKPADMAADGDLLYVADMENSEVKVLDRRSGKLLDTLKGEAASPRDGVSIPLSLAVGPKGAVHLTNLGTGRVISLDRDGHLLGAFGSVALLLLMSLLYVLCTLALGLFISTISDTQQQAMMTALFFFLMPIWILEHGGGEAVADLVQTLRAIRTETPAAGQGDFGLTARELEILSVLVRGYANKDIARHYSISERTVKHHLTHMLHKLGLTSRLELVVFALRDDIAVDRLAARAEIVLADVVQEACHGLLVALVVGILLQRPAVTRHFGRAGLHIVKEDMVPAVGLLQLAGPLQPELAVAFAAGVHVIGAGDHQDARLGFAGAGGENIAAAVAHAPVEGLERVVSGLDRRRRDEQRARRA